jgi:hypothetical protein
VALNRRMKRRPVRGKRGVVFTIVALILLAVIFVIAMSRSRYTLSTRQAAQQERIAAMNDFLTSFQQDAERAAYIAGFRTLIALEDYVSYRAAFLNSTDYYFKEIFYNGSVEGDNYTFYIMANSTFWDYQNKVNEIAGNVNMEFSSEVDRIDLSMKDPWTVHVDVLVSVNLSDRSHLASWKTTRTVSSDIPIFDLRDPLYSVNTLGKLPVVVRRSNITLFVNDTNDRNDTTGLQVHLNNSFYINSSMAPNFLMRFENRLSPDKNGIESLVNLQVLADQGVTIADNNQSVVDYLYFGATSPAKYCSIQNMVFQPDNWFILDQAHAEVYQVNTTLSHTTC